MIKMMNHHCGTIPVVDGDARLNGKVMVRDVFCRFQGAGHARSSVQQQMRMGVRR